MPRGPVRRRSLQVLFLNLQRRVFGGRVMAAGPDFRDDWIVRVKGL
jgi:hypothetical protein